VNNEPNIDLLKKQAAIVGYPLTVILRCATCGPHRCQEWRHQFHKRSQLVFAFMKEVQQ
jgi:hypothetical protein